VFLSEVCKIGLALVFKQWYKHEICKWSGLCCSLFLVGHCFLISDFQLQFFI